MEMAQLLNLILLHVCFYRFSISITSALTHRKSTFDIFISRINCNKFRSMKGRNQSFGTVCNLDQLLQYQSKKLMDIQMNHNDRSNDELMYNEQWY